MKNYTITVNGTTYDVSVEEGSQGAAPAPVASAPVKTVKKAAPAKAAAPAGGQGAVKINAPMPGKILAVKANAGQAIKRGEAILVLEAMKMENEIVAPQDGTVATINVSVGDSVEAGAILATMN